MGKIPKMCPQKNPMFPVCQKQSVKIGAIDIFDRCSIDANLNPATGSILCPVKDSMAYQISKNKDVTHLCNFRFRKRDVKLLDKYAKRHKWSRTRALEELIRNAPLAKEE